MPGFRFVGGLMFQIAIGSAATSIVTAIAALVSIVETNPPAVSDIVLVAVITSAGTLILGIVTLVVGVYTSIHLRGVAKSVDGMKTELVATTARANRAEGVAAGVDLAAAAAATGEPARIVEAIRSPIEAIPAKDGEPTEVKVVQDPADAAVRVKPESKR